MDRSSGKSVLFIPYWQRNLLVASAVFTVLLIAMGGILCVTQSIRNCPDWPGCFGSVIPPLEAGPVLEYTHRLLAATSAILILAAAISGVVRRPRIGWISLPPWIAIALLVEVSYFGAQVVLRGLSPGWAAVDVGSALLVVALMVATATIAWVLSGSRVQSCRLKLTSPPARLALVAIITVYLVLLSGVLVAGQGSMSACLGWPFYSAAQYKLDGHYAVNAFRLFLSIAGLGMIIAGLILAWRGRYAQPASFRIARWMGITLALEMLLQLIMLVAGLLPALMILYTVVAAVLWALLVAFFIRTSLVTALRSGSNIETAKTS